MSVDGVKVHEELYAGEDDFDLDDLDDDDDDGGGAAAAAATAAAAVMALSASGTSRCRRAYTSMATTTSTIWTMLDDD